MAELVSLQLNNSTDYSTSDVIRSYTHRGAVEHHLRIGNEAVGSSAASGTDALNTRIHFKTDANGASNLSWSLMQQVLFYPAYSNDARYLSWSNGICYHTVSEGAKYQLTGVFRYAITTSPTALVRSDFTWSSFGDEATLNAALDEGGCVIKNQTINIDSAEGSNKYVHLHGSCDVLLQPNTDYYLWLYAVHDPTRFYRIFMITGYWDPPLLTVTSSGAANCTITYNANGGSGAPGTDTIVIGSSYTISATQPTRSGYAFLGWNTAADGSGVSYASGVTINTVNSNMILYAIWGQAYSIAYNGNGASSGNMSNSSHYYGITHNLTKNSYVRQYLISYDINNGNTISREEDEITYTFKNWNRAADGSSTTYKDGAATQGLSSTGGTVTLYAQWNTYAVSLPTGTRDGYRFAGWNTKADGSGTAYFGNMTIIPTQNMTLYAQWTPLSGAEANVIFIKINGEWKASTWI